MTFQGPAAVLGGAPVIGILLPNNQRQHRTLHIQKDGGPTGGSMPDRPASGRLQGYLAHKKQRPSGTLQ